MSALTLSGVSASYGSRTVLRDVSFQLDSGVSLAVLGANGSGKSTLLKAIVGIVREWSGDVQIEGKSTKAMPPSELAKRVAYVAQTEPFHFPFTALQTVLMGRTAHSPGFWDGDADLRIAHAQLERVDASAFAHRPITELSGGELQRVWLARALAQEPKVLLLDEPTSHLDLRHAIDFAELIDGLRKDGLTIVAAVHDPNLALKIADRCLILQAGAVVAEGPPHEALLSEATQNALDVDMRHTEVEGESLVYAVKRVR